VTCAADSSTFESSLITGIRPSIWLGLKTRSCMPFPFTVVLKK
jgi:hypothetical protein